LESEDFIEQKGHNFINELVVRLPKESYLTEEVSGKLIFLIEMEVTAIREFIKVYKKYFKKEFERQIIKIA
jgi:hypothetical protein